jgi:LPXTG-motif cell wall-anchored protein
MRGETHHPRARPTRAAVEEVRHLHQIEHTGESEWTPWIAIAGLLLFLASVGLLMFGIVEGAFHLLASTPPGLA